MEQDKDQIFKTRWTIVLHPQTINCQVRFDGDKHYLVFLDVFDYEISQDTANRLIDFSHTLREREWEREKRSLGYKFDRLRYQINRRISWIRSFFIRRDSFL